MGVRVISVREWLRERGVEESNFPPIPEGTLEGGICGRVADRLLPCLLPDGHEGDCDPDFQGRVDDAKERIK